MTFMRGSLSFYLSVYGDERFLLISVIQEQRFLVREVYQEGAKKQLAKSPFLRNHIVGDVFNLAIR